MTIVYPAGWQTVHAGQPIDANGKPCNDGTAVGILTNTIHWPDTSGTVISTGSFDAETAKANSGIAISDAVMRALPNVTFTDAEGKPLKRPFAFYSAATEAEPGLVKMAEAVADATSETIVAQFNALIESLVSAGILAEYTPPETE